MGSQFYIARAVFTIQKQCKLSSFSSGGGITSKGSKLYTNVKDVTESKMLKMQFFATLLPGFCHTAGSKQRLVRYRFYLGHDHNDPLFTNKRAIAVFKKVFYSETARLCKPRSVYVSLRFIVCRHTGRPAWAQNDAMLDAYLDGAEYFYRINDDTRMVTGNWTDMFINTLNR